MQFELRRVVIFTPNMDAMSHFYGHVLDLKLAKVENGWKDYEAGACNIALHRGAATIGRRPPKVVFYADDVTAARELLMSRGAKRMGKVIAAGQFEMCDGKDPDGNPFQLSSRK